METKKKLRCPIGVPAGIIVSLIGLAGTIGHIIKFEPMGLAASVALLLLGAPFVRVTMMVHSANDRLDALEEKLKNK